MPPTTCTIPHTPPVHDARHVSVLVKGAGGDPPTPPLAPSRPRVTVPGACGAVPGKEDQLTETLTSALVEMREDDVLAAVRAAKEAGTTPADIIAALQAA